MSHGLVLPEADPRIAHSLTYLQVYTHIHYYSSDLNVAGGNIVMVDGCSDSNVGGGVNDSCVGGANGLYVVGTSVAE